ncbi:galactokinase [Sporomusa sp.]|uniref:galactokinase n=1 Tax=Sporomusa sp. TaxID=2078658 RepID=UPI002B5E7604|nr:galactokinase [Sporomusa sp.]HWR43983.1 galactokinase [Sporomusa sp.]
MINVDTLKTAFIQAYGAGGHPVQYFFSPGRVNLIGEHIDYNGGYVFPAALTLGIYGAIRLREDSLIVLKSLNTAPLVTVDLNKLIEQYSPDGWANYPKGIIKQLLDSGLPLKGCDILFCGNLPDGTGLSSSAALLVLTAFMLRTVNGDDHVDRAELARFCQKVENQFIGVNCGIMDQFTVAMGKENCAILLDCETLRYKYIPFALDDCSLVIMNTNKKRELSDSKYNERRSECEQALAVIQRHSRITNLCQATLADIETYLTDNVLRRRARHVVTENNRVHTAVNLLEKGDIAGFAELMTQSHTSLKNDYEVTGYELDAIVDTALTAPGCIGARMTGAGFGGCAIALVKTAQLAEFKSAVATGYRAGTRREADFYVAGIANGVSLLEG